MSHARSTTQFLLPMPLKKRPAPLHSEAMPIGCTNRQLGAACHKIPTPKRAPLSLRGVTFLALRHFYLALLLAHTFKALHSLEGSQFSIPKFGQ